MVGIAKSLLSFVFFKGIVFFSVILFSVLGFTEEYIQLEKNIALATMVTPFLVFGLTMSFSHYNLTEKTNKYDWFYWNHLKYSIIVLVLLFLCFSIYQWPNQNAVLLLILFVFARFYSQSFKIKNNVPYSSFIDALPYIVISVSLVFLVLGVDFKKALLTLFGCALFFIFYLINKKVSATPPVSAKGYLFYALGGKAFIVSAIVVAVTMLPRAFVNHFVEGNDIESFLLSLRYATISALVYQFVSIKFYSYIYGLEGKKILVWAGITFSIVFIFTFVCLYLIESFHFINTSKFILLSSMITAIWLTVAFLEYFVSKSKRQIIFVYGVLAFLPFTSYILVIAPGFTNKQYMLVVCLVSVLLSQLISVFYKNLNYMFVSIFSNVIILIIFGLYYV